MKPEELRIGNFVIDKKTEAVCTVDGIQYPNEDVVTEDKKYDDWFRTITPEPIPLTEEWLQKFGVRIYYSEPRFDTNGGVISRSSGQWYVYSGLGSEEDYGCAVDLQYVHQLQNLYFMLQGEELTIKDLTK